MTLAAVRRALDAALAVWRAALEAESSAWCAYVVARGDAGAHVAYVAWLATADALASAHAAVGVALDADAARRARGAS